MRVHTDARAAAAVESLGARAFTYGLHVFLGPRERPDDLSLMAHEVAHVVQQQGQPVLQMNAAGAAGDHFEQEAHHVAGAAQRGERVNVSGRTGGARVQGIWPIDEIGGWVRERVWGLLAEHAPQLVPILRQGVVEWLKGRLGAVLQAILDAPSRGVRAVREVASAVGRHFGNLLGWLREAGAKIARNDCRPISEAAEKIQQVFEGLSAPVIHRVQHVVEQGRAFFRVVGEDVGAPIGNLLQRVGGGVSAVIQRVVGWVAGVTRPIRNVAERAWRWFKNWLGIGEGEEGHSGILQWFQRKAGEAWNWVLARIAPFRRPLMVVAGVLLMLSPAGPIIAVAGAAAGIMRGVQWIRQHFRTREGVVRQQSFLRGTILPAILGALNSVGGAVRNAANQIGGVLNRAMSGISEMASAASSIPVLSLVSGIIGMVADGFRGLASWANEGIRGLADWVQGVLNSLGGFARMLVNFLEEVARIVANVMRLVHFLGGRLWNAIPACVRDPFIDFFIPLILRQIPFFRELASTPEAWAQTRADVMLLIRQFFRDFDLMGAMRTAFRLLLRALRVPVDLAAQVLQKAARAWDVVLARPVQFLINLLRAAGQGFRRFFGNILSHLWYGVQGWLFNRLGDIGITPPSNWDLQGVFRLILQVAGVTLDHVLELLARRVGRPVVERIRRMINFLTGAWEWLRVAITEGPAGLWRMVSERLRDLGRMVLESMVGWIMERVITQVSVRITAMMASAGLGAVVEAFRGFYSAIQTFMEHARRIFEILNTIFDTISQIARGVFGPAAEGLERGLRMAMPVVISFLANFLGLGGLGERIRAIILGIRERVDAAILWLIDRAMPGINSLLGLLRRGGGGREQRFTTRGQSHRVFERGEGRGARLMVQSALQPLYDQLNGWVARLNEVPTNTEVGQTQNNRDIARDLLTTTRTDLQAWENAGADDNARGAAFARIIPKVRQLFIIFGNPEVEQSVIRANETTARVSPPPYGIEWNTRATRVHVAPLTRKAPQGVTGSDRTVENVAGWRLAAIYNQKVANNWERGHLLSFRLHGPGDQRWNLTTITRSVNSSMERVERAARDKFTETHGEAHLTYETRVEYPGTSGPESDFPSAVHTGCWIYNANAPEFKGTPVRSESRTGLTAPDPSRAWVNFNVDSEEDMRLVSGLRRATVGVIYEQRERFRGAIRDKDHLLAILHYQHMRGGSGSQKYFHAQADLIRNFNPTRHRFS